MIELHLLRHADAETGKPFVDVVVDAAGMKGTGTWSSISRSSYQQKAPRWGAVR